MPWQWLELGKEKVDRRTTLSRFTDKIALITGAGRGIGLATAMLIAQEGGTVIGVDLDPAALKPWLRKYQPELGASIRGSRMCCLRRR